MGNLQDSNEPVAWLWQHRETGRTRVLMPDERTATDVAAAWDVVGPLYLAPPQRPAEPVQEPYWYATPDGKYLSSNEVREWMDPKTKALHLEPPQWRKEELIPLYTHPPK